MLSLQEKSGVTSDLVPHIVSIEKLNLAGPLKWHDINTLD